MSDGSSKSANGPAGDTRTIGDSGADSRNEKTWRFQWPITRALKIPAYDPALDKWLDDLADSGDSDTRLAADTFKNQINLADHRRTLWEARYYNLRSTVIILAAALTALASASVGISGTGDLAIKIVTAVLSFCIAAMTGLLELQRTSSRWAPADGASGRNDPWPVSRFQARLAATCGSRKLPSGGEHEAVTVGLGESSSGQG